MSSGLVHSKVTIAISVSLATAGVVTQSPAYLVAATGSLTGLVMNCDLDVDGGNISFLIVRNSIGQFAASLWRIIWYPYAWRVPHRHFISHFPIVSTAIRVAYLLLIPFVIMQFAGVNLPDWFKWYFEWWFVGLCISDTFHAIFDMF